MKKTLRLIIGVTLLVLASGGLFAQGDQQSAAPTAAVAVDDGRQKYALVIGNGAYTGITRLNNPVNDAADISTALRDLGFTVDQLTNAGRVQMEEAVTRLKNRLGAARDSYGFFYYAGHGVQSNGENYLIPVDADISSEAYLRDRSMPMQVILDELNYVGNSLNIVVLDACRDNPFGWRRSGSRGLQVVSNQPADSIIVYATSAGSTAADGEGRNGLFTTHLLNNLKKPGLSVQDVFNQTGADVRQASGGAQIPAIYSQFFDVAYLGTRPPAAAPAPQSRPAPVQPAAPPVRQEPAREYTIYLGGNLRGFITVQKDRNGKITIAPSISEGQVWIGNSICPILPKDGFSISKTTKSIVIDGNTTTVTSTDGKWNRIVIKGNTTTYTSLSGWGYETVIDGNTLTTTRSDGRWEKQVLNGNTITRTFSEGRWDRLVAAGNTLTHTDDKGSLARAVINGNKTTVAGWTCPR
jgi:hypothetical protein